MVLQYQTATHRSECAGAGTHSQRKRTNLLTLATTAIAKKARRHAPTPTRLPLPLLIQEEPTEREEELDEEAQDQEDRDGEEEEARGQEDEDDEEEEAQGQEDEDDEAEEAPQIPTWLGSWKAIVNKKIDLPRSQGGMWQSWTVTKQKLTDWRNASQVAYSGTLQLTYSHTEALISHEKARAKDEMSVDLNDGNSLIHVYDTLTSFFKSNKSPTLRIICHFNGLEPLLPPSSQPFQNSQRMSTPRRTTTQRQIADLTGILESERVAGNMMPELATRWACTSRQCSNHGYICWVSRGEGTRDNPRYHHPVAGMYMRRWNDEIKEEVSSIDAPSPGLAAALATTKAKPKAKAIAVPDSIEPSSMSKTLEMIAIAVVTPLLANIQAQASSALPNPPATQLPTTQLPAPPAPSSPIHSNSNRSEVVKEFFEWYISKYETQYRDELQEICGKLIDDAWSLDCIRSEARGGSMTLAIWIHYGLRLGILGRLQSKISEFKRVRSSASSSTDEEA
ncbi:MAG: hypothetical protein M1840_003970 [Geoglossum simile]|nr:MAG: hypothetical protein M1840_003970 [Geoglossum simile]